MPQTDSEKIYNDLTQQAFDLNQACRIRKMNISNDSNLRMKKVQSKLSNPVMFRTVESDTKKGNSDLTKII